MPRRLLATLLWAPLALLPSCAQGGGGGMDAGPPRVDAGGGRDAGRRDARVSLPDTGPPPMDAGPPDAGPRDAGSDAGRDAGTGACTPSSSNVVISEVMVASQSGGGDLGEWFEIKNTSSCVVNLTNLQIEGRNLAGSDVTVTVPSGLLTAGGFYVFAQSGDAGDNHNLPGVDFVYGAGSSGIVFSNSSGTLSLTYEGALVDRVSWGSVDHTPTESRQLDRSATSSGASLGGADWCDSTNIYSSEAGGPYLGTPGMVNAACP